jgi:purine-binding chemotaxis protein CheW
MTALLSSVAAETQGVSMAQEVLSFNIGAECYALALTSIQEIRAFETPTRLPNQPAYNLGVINLRGTIVPLVDLRVLLGASAAATDDKTSIVVLVQDDHTVGLVVDSVCDVLDLPADAIKPSPLGTRESSCLDIEGLATVQDQMYILVKAAPFLALASALQ